MMNKKPPVLLLHGALGSKDQFDPLRAELKDHFEIYDLNFSGHGGNAFNPAGFGIGVFTAEVLQFLASKNLLSVPVFGYSMGGYVALNLALKHPEKVKKVFTLGTKFNWTPETAAREVKMVNPDTIMLKVPKFARILETRHAPNDWSILLHKTAEMMLELGNGAAFSDEALKSIRQEVVIGLGMLDHMVTEEESRAVAAQLEKGEFKLFEGFKHPLEQTDPTVLARQIIFCFG